MQHSKSKGFFWELIMLKTDLTHLEELKMRKMERWIAKFGPAEVFETSQKLTISRIFWLFMPLHGTQKIVFFFENRSMVFFRIFCYNIPTWCFF